MTNCPIVDISDGERIDEVNEQIRLIQKKKGLTFGTDAFLLAAYIRTSSKAVAVELGGGTGIISLLLTARNKVKTVSVFEIQSAYADLIRRNAELNGFADRIDVHCTDIREINAATLGREVDLVFSNPPYMRCDSGKRNTEDEKFIARHEVCGGIKDFCVAASKLLRYGGKFAVVWRPDRLSELFSALRDVNLEPKRMTFIHADAETEPCMVLLESVKGGAPSMRVSPPLILYQPQNRSKSRILTPQAQKIYDECSFLNETVRRGKQ